MKEILYAVVETGGNGSTEFQEGDVITVEKLNIEDGAKLFSIRCSSQVKVLILRSASRTSKAVLSKVLQLKAEKVLK